MRAYYSVLATAFVFAAACGKPPLCLRAGIVQTTGLPSGSEYQLTAGNLDILNECDRPASEKVTWSTTEPSVASIDSTGKLRGLRPGTIEVVARSGGAESRVMIDVVPAVGTIQITPRDTTIVVGDTAMFTGVALAPGGEKLESVRVLLLPAGGLIPTPYLFALSIINPRLAPSNNSVVVQARQEGTTYIVGRVGSLRDSVRLRITAGSN